MLDIDKKNVAPSIRRIICFALEFFSRKVLICYGKDFAEKLTVGMIRDQPGFFRGSLCYWYDW
jgi:hypothetical protein